jgi:hypothetical protein
MESRKPEEPKKPYAPPKVVHTEKIQGFAYACAMSDDATCGYGPIQS